MSFLLENKPRQENSLNEPRADTILSSLLCGCGKDACIKMFVLNAFRHGVQCTAITPLRLQVCIIPRGVVFKLFSSGIGHGICEIISKTYAFETQLQQVPTLILSDVHNDFYSFEFCCYQYVIFLLIT